MGTRASPTKFVLVLKWTVHARASFGYDFVSLYKEILNFCGQIQIVGTVTVLTCLTRVHHSQDTTAESNDYFVSMEAESKVRFRKRPRWPFKETTNNKISSLSPQVNYSLRQKLSDLNDSPRKKSKKSYTPKQCQTFISDFFSMTLTKKEMDSFESMNSRWTELDEKENRENTPSTSSADNEDEIICIGNYTAQKTQTQTENEQNFLSDEEVHVTDEIIPPQYISDVESVVKSFPECYVTVNPTLQTLKFKNARIKVEKIDAKDLEVMHYVEYDVLDWSRSSSENIPEDASDILSNYPEEKIEYCSEYNEVDKILAISVKHDERKFLLKWKGYPYAQCSWEKSDHLVDINVLGTEFEKRILICKKTVLHLLADDFKHLQKKWACMNTNFLDINAEKFLDGLVGSSYNSIYRIHEWEDEMNRVLAENSQAKLYIENWTDAAHKPKDFKYILTNKLSLEVEELLNESQRLFQETLNSNKSYITSNLQKINAICNYGCTCTESECGTKKKCCPEYFDVHFKYTSKGKLRRDFDPLEQLVECWDHCACSSACSTRLVQRGRQVPVLLFKTYTRGWGVRAAQKIEERSFVMEYVGEVITLEEASKRDPTYVFDLDGCGAAKAKFAIDATHYGNEARFINHSCDPNLIVVSVYVEHLDQRFHRLALFALRDIQEGEELTFNYFSNINEEKFKEKAKRVRSKKSLKRCHCGTAKCRKVFA